MQKEKYKTGVYSLWQELSIYFVLWQELSMCAYAASEASNEKIK